MIKNSSWPPWVGVKIGRRRVRALTTWCALTTLIGVGGLIAGAVVHVAGAVLALGPLAVAVLLTNAAMEAQDDLDVWEERLAEQAGWERKNLLRSLNTPEGGKL